MGAAMTLNWKFPRSNEFYFMSIKFSLQPSSCFVTDVFSWLNKTFISSTLPRAIVRVLHVPTAVSISRFVTFHNGI